MADPGFGRFVRRLADVGIADRGLAGGKGASLGELARAGFAVTDGYVVTTAAFSHVREVLGFGPGHFAEIEGLDASDHAGIERVAARIRGQIRGAPLPAAVREAITVGYLALPGSGVPVAVRSSATAEDGDDASFAGLQDTYLWIRGPDAVAEHVRRCWASLYSAESVSYRRRMNLPEAALGMGVVVQRMVDARCSGVMFTRSPTTGDRSVVALEASWGLGSAIVSGDVTPDTYVVSKVTGEVIKRTVAAKLVWHRMAPGGDGVVAEEMPSDLRCRACLNDAEIRALVTLGSRVEDHYGAPQDIEWAMARDGGIFLLQSRPETVWANRAAAPVAVPRKKAFNHVVELLGKSFPG